ncbi:hypothetical protein L1887_21597 [Cichorium endivia]|nr:hypothetical protein L1887_21597 [Cichorium endivia]
MKPRHLSNSLMLLLSHQKQSGRLLLQRLPKHGNETCTILYPASAKASHDLGCGYSNYCLGKFLSFGLEKESRQRYKS